MATATSNKSTTGSHKTVPPSINNKDHTADQKEGSIDGIFIIKQTGRAVISIVIILLLKWAPQKPT